MGEVVKAWMHSRRHFESSVEGGGTQRAEVTSTVSGKASWILILMVMS